MTEYRFELREDQRARAKRFQEWVFTQIEKPRHDSCGTSPFEFRIRGSGLGDSVSYHGLGYKCCLTIDDDGELLPEKFLKEEDSWSDLFWTKEEQEQNEKRILEILTSHSDEQPS